MPFDYKILVYNLKASTPTKNMLYFSTTNAKEKYMGIGFDFPAAIGVYFSIFCYCQIILLKTKGVMYNIFRKAGNSI